MKKEDKIFVAGHNGMVGAAVLRALKKEGFNNILTASKKDLDLTNQSECEAFFAKHRPDVVLLAAAKVGGIYANNTYPVEFMEINLAIALNTIRAAYNNSVKRLLFLGSTCIYPKMAEQPIKESELLKSALEPTNEAYAIAKIAGLKLCEYYRREYGLCYHSAMPTNLYGQGDNYNEMNSHVLPALIQRFHNAKEAGDANVAIWGSGSPLREFLHVDDLAEALLFLLELDNPPDLVNVGSNEELSIKDLALTVADVVGYKGDIVFDGSKPDGTPRKFCDKTLINSLGWESKISIRDGIASTYKNYLEELENGTIRL